MHAPKQKRKNSITKFAEKIVSKALMVNRVISRWKKKIAAGSTIWSAGVCRHFSMDWKKICFTLARSNAYFWICGREKNRERQKVERTRWGAVVINRKRGQERSAVNSACRSEGKGWRHTAAPRLLREHARRKRQRRSVRTGRRFSPRFRLSIFVRVFSIALGATDLFVCIYRCGKLR